MPSRASGHVGVGSVSATLGAVGLVGGIMRPSFLAGQFLDTPIWALTITGGLVLTLAGAMILVFSFRGPEEEAPLVPAHVAFNSRMSIPDIVPPVPGTRAAPIAAAAATAAAMAPASAPAAAPAPTARLPAPAPLAQQRVAPAKPDIATLDAQIRELTRKINKAGVMLATGQLSQQGYLAYVDDLKKQRARLEAARVKHELRG